MIKHLIFTFIFLSFCFSAFAQKQDSVKTSVSGKKSADKVVVTQDSIKKEEAPKETRKERRRREKAEKEAKEEAENALKDSARLAIEHKSTVAWKRSLMVPGWGQYSNGGLWWIKVPVIYGGFVSTGLIIEFNHRYYRRVIKELDFRLKSGGTEVNDEEMKNQSTDGLIRIKDGYRRNRDLAILATVGWYGLNVVEAYVDSMLKNRWSIGDAKRFTYRFSPTVLSANGQYAFQQSPLRPHFGVKMTLQFK